MSDLHFGAQVRDVVLPGAGCARGGEKMSEERRGNLTWRRLWKKTEPEAGNGSKPRLPSLPICRHRLNAVGMRLGRSNRENIDRVYQTGSSVDLALTMGPQAACHLVSRQSWEVDWPPPPLLFSGSWLGNTILFVKWLISPGVKRSFPERVTSETGLT